jgi:hypothetical protein
MLPRYKKNSSPSTAGAGQLLNRKSACTELIGTDVAVAGFNCWFPTRRHASDLAFREPFKQSTLDLGFFL